MLNDIVFYALFEDLKIFHKSVKHYAKVVTYKHLHKMNKGTRECQQLLIILTP